MKHSIIMLLLLFNLTLSFSQTSKIDSLLTIIGSEVQNSKELVNNKNSKLILNQNKRSLNILASFFLDSSKSNVYSECQNRFLNKGELAIILADRIEMLPYALITGVQNCLLTFCKDNKNLVEYYLSWNEINTKVNFQNRYLEWLKSKGRKKWRI
ncbi:MAG: hypothetical protein WKF88_00695 [Ferruginibacter sp.]